MKTIRREFFSFMLTVLPALLLFFYWSDIPETIPMHYGIDGEPDRYGSKETLAWMVPCISIFIYVLLLIIPVIDPKKRITSDNRSFYILRMITVGFIGAFLIAYIFSLTGVWVFSRTIPLILLAFVVLFGNFMPTLKPNYFMGIRTPWTLEDADVWTRTHRFSGRLWMVGGIVGILISIIAPSSSARFSFIIITVLAVLSILYSYIAYKRKSSH